MRSFTGAAVRVNWLVAGTEEDAKAFLGPLATEFLTFADPERQTVAKLGLERLPALVHIRQDMSVAGASEGWNPDEWRAITDNLSKAMSWSRPVVPDLGDPAPYAGTPAAG
jgi:hypothetical protein